MNYLGIDLGGTNIAAAVLDADYRIIARAQRKTACPARRSRSWTICAPSRARRWPPRT